MRITYHTVGILQVAHMLPLSDHSMFVGGFGSVDGVHEARTATA